MPIIIKANNGLQYQVTDSDILPGRLVVFSNGKIREIKSWNEVEIARDFNAKVLQEYKQLPNYHVIPGLTPKDKQQINEGIRYANMMISQQI